MADPETDTMGWDHSFDVLVMGSGGAGQCAALRAHDLGLDVLIAEKGATWGGSTRAFAEQGVLPAILNRLPADETRDALAVFEELREAERTTATHGRHATVPLEQIRAEGKP